MTVAKWHSGKLVILWSWGGLFAGLALTHFLSAPVTASPLTHLLSLAFALMVLLALSILTWQWLSGREGEPGNE